MKKPKLIEVIIDRRKWSRNKSSNALVVNEEIKSLAGICGGGRKPKIGQMCCLGFLGKTMGLTKKEMAGRGYPSDPDRSVELGLRDEENSDDKFDFYNQAAQLNDHENLTDKQREIQLAKLARKNGYKFTFIN